jgi:hypothetical protein
MIWTLADRNNRRFVEHNAFAAHIDQRIRRAQVYGKIIRKQPAQSLEHE